MTYYIGDPSSNPDYQVYTYPHYSTSPMTGKYVPMIPADDLTMLKAEFDAFKAEVKQIIQDWADEIGESNVDGLLDSLGYEPVTRAYAVEVIAHQKFMVNIIAETEEDAMEKVREMKNRDVVSCADSNVWIIAPTGYVSCEV